VNLLANLEKQPLLFKILLEYLLIGFVGILDFITGYELAFSLFYVIPIALATWYISKQQGIIVSFVSTIVWLWIDLASGHSYSQPFFQIWDSFIRLSFFLLIALLLSALKSSWERERELAYTDNLTGAANSRRFFEILNMEMNRAQRYKHPFTLVYIDLDNFKTVNDQFGHFAGDEVLRIFVTFAKKNLRKIDLLARLGGDEFALLLPETNEDAARVVLTKLHDDALNQMQQNNWPITFSLGALTCNTVPSSTDELIKMADALMYQVKRNGKNAIAYSTYAG
jgi:diguanylate cyclase (GGDEF)-like protein